MMPTQKVSIAVRDVRYSSKSDALMRAQECAVLLTQFWLCHSSVSVTAVSGESLAA